MNDISINLGDDILIGQDNGISLNEETNLVSSDSVLVGPPGPQGSPGFSPIANVTQTQSGATITITDERGTTSAMIDNGLPGVSPIASVTETSSGAVIEITDVNGTTTASVNNGNNGADGENATIQIGSVTSLNYGETPTVTNVGTDTHAVLNWGIPAGQQGIQGIQGEPGINAQAYVTQNTGSATITIEDADGITTATVYDGANGTDGFSPIATVTQNTGSAIISIQDANGTTSATIYDGQNGMDGITPSITASASVTNTTGTPSCSVTKSGTDANPNFAFAFTNIKGETGATGPAGADGFSPSATVTQNTGSATISITDKNGTTTATIYDGTTPDTSVSTYSLDNTPAHSGGSNTITIRKQLSVVSMNVDTIWTNSISTSWATIGTLPSAIVPTANISCAGTVIEGNNGSVVAYGKVQIQTDGNVRFRANSAYSGLSAYGFSISWII